MATINLGSIKFNWQGAYAGGTAYAVDDVVSYNGSSYVCILASTGNLPTNGTYWNVMAEGGDVATTLTTQGDILFRDGSGLQRLAKGTAGQVLQMNSGATAPEYGTVSSDFVKIHESSLSGADTYTLSNLFNSTYNSYIVELQNYTAHSNGGSIYVRMVTSGGVQTSSEYYHAASQVTRDSSNGTGGQNNTGWGSGEWWLSNSRTDPLYGAYANMTFSSVGVSGYPRGTSSSIAFDGTSQIRHNTVGFIYNSSITATGIYFFTNGTNNWQATVRVYGRK